MSRRGEPPQRRQQERQHEKQQEEREKVITIKFKEPPKEKKSTRSGKDYCKEGPTKQDLISENPKLIMDKLKAFERISEDKYAEIDVGTFIRYVSFDRSGNSKIRLGGFVIKNGAPDYLVLRSGAKGRHHVTWSVPLKCNPKISARANIYFKKKGLLSKDERIRHGLETYDALQSGQYRLIDRSSLAKLTGEEQQIMSRLINKLGDESDDEGEDVTPTAPKVKVNLV